MDGSVCVCVCDGLMSKNIKISKTPSQFKSYKYKITQVFVLRVPNNTKPVSLRPLALRLKGPRVVPV